MKCSHKGDFIIILFIILTSNDKGKAFVLLSNENSLEKNPGVFSAPKNTLQDLDIFTNINNPDNPKHKIVKKQMVISDENQLSGRNKNYLVDKEKSFSTDTSTNSKDNNINVANGLNSLIIQKPNEHAPMPNYDERERFMRPPRNIIEEDEKKYKKLKAIRRNKFREERDLLMKKKMDLPDTCDDPDNEPSNEWTDATQEHNQKIPPEFTPKPKLMLKVFHLQAKRESKNNEIESTVGKRQIWNRFRCLDAGRRAFHPAKAYSTRVHPRSFLVRIKKKGESRIKHQDKKSEAEKQENDEEDDEESEEDDDDLDDEEEEEETEYEDADEDSVSITTKPDRKDAIKEFFKTAKEAVINRAKFDDGFVSGSLKAEGGKESLTPNKNDKEASLQEKSKKVLIDANIKLDGAISHALKSLLGYGNKKDNKDKLVREKGMEENLNAKNTNNESQLMGITEQPSDNGQRNKRNFRSLLNKKNRDNEGLEKGFVSVDSLINSLNSEYDREELLQKLHQKIMKMRN